MVRNLAGQYDPYGDWGVDSHGREVNAMGQHKIVGYSPDRQPSRGFGGLNEHYARQNYDGPHKAIQDFANEARKSGALIDRNGQRMEDTWENRGFTTHLSDKNPYPVTPAPGQPNFDPKAAEDNRRFAGGNAGPEKTSIGDAYKMMDESAGKARDESQYTMPPGLSPNTSSSRLPSNPYADRQANVDQAMRDGTFDSIRGKYNEGAPGSPMDEYGKITPLLKTDDGTGTSPYARATLGPGAQEIAARRDFARGEAPVQFSGQAGSPTSPLRAEKMNPYGTATAEYSGPSQIGGTMPDPLNPGKTIPMRQWAADQSAVQATKFGPNAGQAGEDYLNPKKVSSYSTPLGSMDAEQFKAIARGGKMPRAKTPA